MRIKTNRNELCPCGSGQKYKKCCLLKEAPSAQHNDLTELAWYKLRRTEGDITLKHLTPYFTQELSELFRIAAYTLFFPKELPEQFDRDIFLEQCFMPWALFNWMPLDDFEAENFDPNKTIAQNYLYAYGEKLTSYEKRFIREISKTYYSFYSVIDVEFEKSITVKDILLGTTHTLKEIKGTHELKRGHIVFSRILNMDNQSIFVGMAPLIIPVDYHNDIINFRKWLAEEESVLKISKEILHNHEVCEMLIEYFFDIIESIYRNPMPIMTNTEGDEWVFSKSYLKITISPEEAFYKLLPLTLSSEPEEFLSDAVRNKNGEITKIEFPWLKKGSKKMENKGNTLLGNITIKEERIILETNSNERTAIGKELLHKYLGGSVSFQQTLIETMEQKINSMMNEDEDIKSVGEPEEKDSPEFQAYVEEMAKSHWEKWFDEPIPALGDQTPREAAKTKDGQEKLSALLLVYERHNIDSGDKNLLKADVEYLRKELSLEDHC